MAARRLNDSRIGAHLDDDVGVRASTRTFSSSHAQHGVALFIALDAQVVIGEVRGAAVIVPADCENEVSAPGPVIGICFDPERMPRVHAFSRAVGRPAALEGKLAASLQGLAHAYRADWDRGDVLRGIADEAHMMFAPAQPRLDRRVIEAMAVIRNGGSHMGTAASFEFAHDAQARRILSARTRIECDVVEAFVASRTDNRRNSISRAHLQELFARDVGTSMRTYRLWHRLWRALRAFSSSDATAAAYAAGFADLAHFSRTCRRMLGYSPTSLRDGV